MPYFPPATVNAVDSVNTQTGDVVLDQDDILDGTTYKQYSDTDKSKLAGIEAAADVTDATNVEAAGALMDSEVDADIKTLSLPASTTISAFGATLVDDADAATARTTIGLGNVDNTSDATKNSASATLTNKTISGASNTISNISPSQRTGGFYIGTISAATFGTTGNKAITGVGFQPKLVRFTLLPSSTFNTSSSLHSRGAMTSSSQFVDMQYTSIGTSASTKQGLTTACIGFITTATALMLASYVSMDADGFTINVGTANGTFDVAYECYA